MAHLLQRAQQPVHHVHQPAQLGGAGQQLERGGGAQQDLAQQARLQPGQGVSNTAPRVSRDAQEI